MEITVELTLDINYEDYNGEFDSEISEQHIADKWSSLTNFYLKN